MNIDTPRQSNSSVPGLVQDFQENIPPQVILLAEIHDLFAQFHVVLIHGTLEQPWLQVLASTCNCILQMLLLSKANSNRIILVVACLMAFSENKALHDRMILHLIDGNLDAAIW